MIFSTFLTHPGFGSPLLPGTGPLLHSIEPDINKIPQIIIKGIRNTIKFLIDLRSIFEYILIFKFYFLVGYGIN